MTHPRLPPTLICGVVRDGGEGLLKTLRVVQGLKDHLEDWSAVFVTNDNTDGTDAVLAGWEASNPEHHLIRLDGLAAAIPDRVDRIATARNFYLEHLRSRTAGRFQLLMVLDLDGPNEALDAPTCVAAINAFDQRWDALFANQRQAYYDIYALRHDSWCPNDCWEQVKRATRHPFRGRRRRAAVLKYIYCRQYRIPADHAPIPVRSAFGGLGLYRTDCLRECWYPIRPPLEPTACEHVGFNQAIKSRGGSLFILPGLLNDAPAEHLRAASGGPPPPGFGL